VIARHGVNLEQQKDASLKYPIQTLAVPETLAKLKRFSPSKENLGAGALIAAAEAANIIDEFDGVPLYQKMKRMRRLKISTVLACCFDEDPYTTSAMATLRENTDAIIAGLVFIARVCGAKENKIVVATAHEAKKIKKKNPQADLLVAGERYPARALLKRKLQARDKKTAYIGAQACAALTAAVDDGEGQNFTVVTVAGSGVENWLNLRVRIGTPLQNLCDYCGISEKTEMIIIGSSVMGKAITDLSTPVTAATRCMIALTKLPKHKTYPCIGCAKCTRACPRGIIPWMILKEMERPRPDLLKLPNAQKCIRCASCSIVCPSGIDLAGVVTKAAAIKKSGDFDSLYTK
jgi:Na+-translocating ferredoxin:NAD+ oxidoreductase subunit C